MATLTLFNQEYENTKLEVDQIDKSDGLLGISIHMKEDNADWNEHSKVDVSTFWLNEDEAKALVSYLKQQFNF